MGQPLPKIRFWDILMETPWTSIPFRPRCQIVHVIARFGVYSPAAYIPWAIAVAVSLPIFACITGILLVIDGVAVAVEFIYTTLKRRTTRTRRGILDDGGDLVSDQLPTINNHFSDSTPKISSRLSSAFIPDVDHTFINGSVLAEKKLSLCKIPSTSLTCIYENLNLALPQPCAQVGGRIRKSESQFTFDPPPPYL
ncbi:01a4bc44-dd89-4b02-a0af-79b581e20c79-CDS [Sclerotinia trifoliorum]|uniref:01a4bc44-dd89-4b02-a0af-79b581e20c79-CDS n=1 Tax=Sclerotinia trifoliorum TaxID=28548 RepID=A0A8H2VW76_9HELO|nr:01a4bc44-dd89-4b02-a0af-79b581e20c79-CDS [Sclerotinia trifoliorum]